MIISNLVPRVRTPLNIELNKFDPKGTEKMKNAVEFVLKLMRERRWFLSASKEGSLDVLDPEIFSEAILLNEKVRNTYSEAKAAAEGMIISGEAELGITAATIPQGQSLVECSRFTGGFDICQVIDLYDFSEFIPYDHTSHDIEGFYYRHCFRGRNPDGFSPIQTSKFRCQAEEFAVKVQGEFERLKECGPLDDRFVLILKTRFNPSGADSNGDMVGGRLSGMQNYPHLMGYLLTKYSEEKRIVGHNYVITSTSYFDPHVSMYHWSSGELILTAEKERGYDCLVYFATII